MSEPQKFKIRAEEKDAKVIRKAAERERTSLNQFFIRAALDRAIRQGLR